MSIASLEQGSYSPPPKTHIVGNSQHYPPVPKYRASEHLPVSVQLRNHLDGRRAPGFFQQVVNLLVPG